VLFLFRIINGFYDEQNRLAEFIDYAAGNTQDQNVTAFSKQPLGLPRSETQTLIERNAQSNIFCELPSISGEYVRRVKRNASICLRPVLG
jgi:hypothetical protein